MEIGVSIERFLLLENELILNPIIPLGEYSVYSSMFRKLNIHDINQRNKAYKVLLKLKSKHETN